MSSLSQLATEAARLRERLESFGIQTMGADRVEEAWREAQREVGREDSMWASGREPLPFDLFSLAVDGTELFPRQRKVVEEAGILTARQLMDPNRRTQEILLVWGKGGTKDWISARYGAWSAHVVMSLAGEPCRHLGLSAGSRVFFMNTAPNEQTARDVYFEQYLKHIVHSDVFAPFRAKPGFSDTAQKMLFPAFGVQMDSMHSRAVALEGRAPFQWTMDEADEFQDAKGVSNAERIYRVLSSSAATRFINRWLGLIISYTRTEDGFMLSRYKEAVAAREHGDFSAYADLASTPEANPRISLQDPTIAKAFREDSRLASAMYLCQPMAAVDAFFDYTERIEQAVDPSIMPCCEWDEEITTTTLRNGTVCDVVGVQIASIYRTPGKQYFLGGDGGKSGDAFSLSIYGVDISSKAVPYICPDCGGTGGQRDMDEQRILRGVGHYVQVTPMDVRSGQAMDASAQCGFCGQRPGILNRFQTLAGWWKSGGFNTGEVVIDAPTGKVIVPRITEEAVIEFKPKPASRPGEQNCPVDFDTDEFGVSAVCLQLIEGLGITQGRLDPWNTASIVQRLRNKTGCDIDEISFSNPEQFKRARLLKCLLYGGALGMLSVESVTTPAAKRALETRLREWRRLQRLGLKIDHPAGGSKDHFDSGSIAISLAATYAAPELKFMFGPVRDQPDRDQDRRAA